MNHAPGGVTSAWVHRGNEATLLLRLRTDPGEELSRLVVAPPGDQQPIHVATTPRRGPEETVHDVVLDVGGLIAGVPDPTGSWQLSCDDGAEAIPIRSEEPEVAFRVATADEAWTTRARTDEGRLGLVVEPAEPWAEVETVEHTPGGLVLSGRVIGGVAKEVRWVVARRTTDGVEQSWSATGGGQAFTARLHPSTSTDRLETWELLLRGEGAPDLALARHLDDIHAKERVIAHPWYPVEAADGDPVTHELRPSYGPHNEVALQVRPKSSTRGHSRRAEREASDAEGKAGQRAQEEPRPRSDLRSWLLRILVAPAVHLLSRATRVLRGEPPPVEHAPVQFLLLNAFGMGGTIRTVGNLANALAREREVHMISVLRERDEPFFPPDHRVQLHTLVDRRSSRARGWRDRLVRTLDRRSSVLIPRSEPRFHRFSLLTDLLLLRTVLTLPPGILVTTRPGLNLVAARFAPRRLITIGQEHLPFSAHRPALRSLIIEHYGSLDALGVLTGEDERDYGAALAKGDTVIRRIANSVPDIVFPVSDLSAKRVVAGGRMGAAKGFDLLVPAFGEVVERHPDWTLRIYGSGPSEAKVRRAIKRHGLAEHVLVMGRTNRIWQEMAKASIFVMSSRFEGFPMVLIEALNCGLPVVSFDCPRGPAEIVDPEVTGLLVPPRDVPGLAQALNRMIEDDDLRARCGRNAVSGGARYSITRIAQEWVTLFSDGAQHAQTGARPAHPATWRRGT